MVISHKYKFIFVKTVKTAGTSIEVFLSDQCGKEDIFTPLYPPVEPHLPRNYRGLWNPIGELTSKGNSRRRRDLIDFLTLIKFYNHIPACRIKKRVPKTIWNDYYKFCVERNPWDKTISVLSMINKVKGLNLTLDQYLDRGKYSLNYPRYTDKRGNLMVDKVIKYECLNKELGKVFKMLGVEFNGELGVNAKNDYRTNRTHYRSLINPEQRERIERIFEKEIEFHGYEF